MLIKSIAKIFFILLICLTFSLRGEDKAKPGIYAVWYAANKQVMKLPYVRGGQVMAQWGEIDENGNYQWQSLASFFSLNPNLVATVQINGNYKPPYLFDHTPYITNWGNPQVYNSKGILMYWHPYFIQSYSHFLQAYANYLNLAPFKAFILGVRVNFNAIGTEFSNVPPPYRAASLWTVPPGVVNGPSWTQAISNQYMKLVLDTHINGFIKSFSNPIRLFVRTLPQSIKQSQVPGMPEGYTYNDYFYDGTLCLFQTGSEVEPRTSNAYLDFLTFCRPGYTLGYTEPWADAWGYHGNTRDHHWCTPPQWNYWRLLSDLNIGISFIAVYGSDLNVALTGNGANIGSDYQSEFDQAFQFASRYAGYHHQPTQAPGAWIAFREGKNQQINSYNQLVSDYNMHMRLINPEDTIGLDARYDGLEVPIISGRNFEGQKSIGPYNSRFGAWARQLHANQAALLEIDPDFIQGLNESSNGEVRITYLDNNQGSFTVAFGDQTILISLSNSGLWETAIIPIHSSLAKDSKGAYLTIQTLDSSVTFHMIEVVKSSS